MGKSDVNFARKLSSAECMKGGAQFLLGFMKSSRFFSFGHVGLSDRAEPVAHQATQTQRVRSDMHTSPIGWGLS